MRSNDIHKYRIYLLLGINFFFLSQLSTVKLKTNRYNTIIDKCNINNNEVLVVLPYDYHYFYDIIYIVRLI